jgi:hypothetical protein
MIAFILFVVSCLSSAYLIYRFEIDLSSWEINLGIFGSLTMNAFIAYYFPLFYIALFALWIPIGLFFVSYLSLFEGRSIK